MTGTDYRWRRALSSGGTPYAVMERVSDVPRVPRKILDSVVFVYPSESDAKAGTALGGTGVLVDVPYSDGSMLSHLYVVTNEHVIERNRPSVLRLNKIAGGTDTYSIEPHQWTGLANNDIAVAAVDLDQHALQIDSISTSLFATETQVEEQVFGPGDECLFVGRHVGLDGKEANTPAARFGAVSVIRPEPLSHDTYMQESIAVEARSLSGFSGAPVYVWQSPPILPPVYKDRMRDGKNSLIGKWEVVVHSHTESPFAFLGLTWGHMKGRQPVIGPGWRVTDDERRLALNSGIMVVVPAWKIRELLDSEELSAMREESERQHREQRDASPVELDVSTDDGPTDEGRISLDGVDPQDALRALLKTPPHAQTQDPA